MWQTKQIQQHTNQVSRSEIVCLPISEPPEDIELFFDESNACLILENEIECRRGGETGLEVLVGETDAENLVGESGGVSLGVLLCDANRKPLETPCLEADKNKKKSSDKEKECNNPNNE